MKVELTETEICMIVGALHRAVSDKTLIKTHHERALNLASRLIKCS